MRFTLPLHITCLPLALLPTGGCFNTSEDDLAEVGDSSDGTDGATATEDSSGESTDSSGDTTDSSTETTDGSEMAASCGNGIVEEGEECDPGADQIGSEHACTSECLMNVCGDGNHGPAEGCDDGNTVDGDGCTALCAPEQCMNGIVDLGEECDDANLDNGDECLMTCVWASCGDGFVHVGVEACDTGALLSDTAECTIACANAVCGDGLVWAGVEACDDANALEFDACTTACTDFAAPVLSLSFSQIKQFEFEWDPIFGADYYQLLESAEPGSPFVQVGDDLMGTSTSLTVPLHLRLNASYQLRACKDGEGCTASAVVDVSGDLVDAIGYVKASNPNASDQIGYALALSADGSTLAVGAHLEDSGADGINGNQADNSATDAGAVYVFVRNDQGVWSQQAYVKASNSEANDLFGMGVALSADGNTLAVTARYEDSSAVGINGNQASNAAVDSGAAYVFVRSGQLWSQQAYIKASNTGADDRFGHASAIALSSDGNTLAVGAYAEDSAAVGIGGNQADNSASASGATYVFVRNQQQVWSQQAYLKASNTGASDYFGVTLALSGDGNTLAVDAIYEDSSAAGIGGNQADNAGVDSGAVYVFVRGMGGAWSQQAYIKASNPGGGDEYGSGIALSHDGSTLAIGAYREDSIATDIGGNQADNSAPEAGAVYVFVRNLQNVWSQQAYVKAPNTNTGDNFGIRVGLSGDGNLLAVGAHGEDSAALGLGGNQADNLSAAAGAVYVLQRNQQGAWSHRTYVKAPNSDANDNFGYGVALSADGSTLAAGARLEDSSAAGFDGDPSDNSLVDAGAVYLY